MANLTGQLGTKDAQPGSIELGSGPPNDVRTFVTTTSVLGKSIAKLGTFKLGAIDSTATASITQDIVEVIYTTSSDAWVTHDIIEVIYGQRGGGFDVSDRKTDSGTITETFAFETTSGSNLVAATQDVIEVIYATVSDARVTHDVIEVIYRPDNNQQTVHDAITVTSTPTTQFATYRKIVTDGITVAETRDARSSVKHSTVTDAIVVADTKAFYEPVRHITVTDSISVASIPTHTQSHGAEISISVIDSIGVNETRAARNNVIRLSVITAIAVAVPEAERDDTQRKDLIDTVQITETFSLYEPIKHLAVTDVITVSQSVIFQENPLHLTVTSNITITDTALGITNRPIKQVTDSITVTSRIEFFTGYLTVADMVHLGESFEFTRTPVRLTISDTILMSENLGSRNKNLRITYEDDIFIPQFFTDIWPATSRISPNRQKVTDTFTVGLAIAGGSPIQHQSVTTNVTVIETIKQNRFFLSVIDTVIVETNIRGGTSIRAITVSDALHPVDQINTRKSPNEQSVNDLLKLSTKNVGVGPIVPITVVDTIHITYQNNGRINVGSIVVTDAISVGEPFANHGTVRTSYTDKVTITENKRANAPRLLTVMDAITVTSRPKLLSQIVKDSLTLAEEQHRVFVQSVTDTVQITQTVGVQQVIVRNLRHAITATPLVTRAGIFVVNVADTMIIPESQYLLPINGKVISLPGGRGTLVSNMLTLTSGKGAIVLPAAQLGNQRGNVESVTVQRSMNAKTVTLIKSSDREKLKLAFRIGLRKSFELRQFIIDNISEIITLTNWDGDVWVGFIMNNPFEQTHSGRSAPVEGEFATVEVDFEGVKS